MTDMELAEEIEQHKLYLGGYPTEAQCEQIIAALRRVPIAKHCLAGDGGCTFHKCDCPTQEGYSPTDRQATQNLTRPPSGEMVMVPREDLIRWACWLEEADSSLGPYWLGAKRDKAFKEAADEIRSRLAGTFSCPHCGISTPHQHSIDRKGNVILSAAEAEGRKS